MGDVFSAEHSQCPWTQLSARTVFVMATSGKYVGVPSQDSFHCLLWIRRIKQLPKTNKNVVVRIASICLVHLECVLSCCRSVNLHCVWMVVIGCSRLKACVDIRMTVVRTIVCTVNKCVCCFCALPTRTAMPILCISVVSSFVRHGLGALLHDRLQCSLCVDVELSPRNMFL